MKSICLFTAHPPQGGGGVVILHSLIDNLPGLNIKWYYITPEAVPGYEEGYIGSGFMGGSILKDLYFSWTMLNDTRNPLITAIVNKLLSIECDYYWIISHNEGLRVALELARRQIKRPIHLTVHDDWAGALAQRSVRYRFFAGLSKKLTQKAIERVSSCDVISQGMKKFYNTFSSAKLEVCHRYLPLNTLSQLSHSNNNSEIRVGHIGSVYEETDLFRFLYLLKEYAAKTGKKCSMHFWGFRKKRKFPEDLQSIVFIYDDISEPLAITALQKCSLVYAMYPSSKKMRLFSQTSLPTKLTTYVQVGIPIFGHGPQDSTLSLFLQDTKIGTNWTGDNFSDGNIILDRIVNQEVLKSDFINARNKYFGEANLQVIRSAFSG